MDCLTYCYALQFDNVANRDWNMQIDIKNALQKNKNSIKSVNL